MIRALKKTDIAGLNSLPPTDWNFNYECFLKEFLATNFFYAFVLIQNEKIVGTGNVLIKGKLGWLANIIVDNKYRGEGFGSKITKYLVEFLNSKGCETQLLIATDLGEPVYKKIGFKKLTEYRCFLTEKDNGVVYSNAIRKLVPSDLEDLVKMDRDANDEDREHLISKYYKTGFGYFNNDNKLLGFYLPDFGRGLVISKQKKAGIELLKLKHAQKGKKTLIPIENLDGIRFFENSGLKEGLKCSRMVLGKENDWNPECIYSYGGGHCG